MGYSEKDKKWKHGLQDVSVEGKRVWVNTGELVVKLNISRVLPSVNDGDGRNIMSLLRFLNTLYWRTVRNFTNGDVIGEGLKTIEPRVCKSSTERN